MESQPPPPPLAVATSAVDTGTSIHIFFFPFAARGHTIALLETARLFAQHPGTRCTFVTTPGNSSYILPNIDDARASSLPLDLILIPFPAAEVGLPAGVESTDALPHDDADSQQKFGRAQFLLNHSFKDLVAVHRPDCIISDCIEIPLSVPCFVFSSIPPFAKSVAENVYMMTTRTGAAAADSGDQTESNVVCSLTLMGLPHKLEVTRAEIPAILGIPAWIERLADAERRSCGIIFNTFYELESEYVDHCARTNLTGKAMKVWCVGPVQLYKSIRAAADELEQDRGREIKDWLNSKEPESVLYVSFGSECFFTPEQLREIAVGLQSCKHCFIWVVRRGGGGGGCTIQDWLPSEFHETVRDRGLILTEWAPQVAILNHTATGGFLTHCGWNSTIEAVCAGLPLIAWPLHSEQFFNERHVVEILGIGMRILDGAEMRSVDPKGKGLVKGEVIRDAVDRLMGGGEEDVRTMRAKARKYQELARSSMEEGGSSYVNLSSVIELIKGEKKKKKKNIDVEAGI